LDNKVFGIIDAQCNYEDYHLLLFTHTFQLHLVNSKNDKTYLSMCFCWLVTLV